mgnify:FL=1
MIAKGRIVIKTEEKAGRNPEKRKQAVAKMLWL